MQFRRIAVVVSTIVSLMLGLYQQTATAAGCAGRVFRDSQFQGEARGIRQDTSFVGDHWNDQISSIEVFSGVWRFYRDANFQGAYLEVFPGRYSFQDGDHWNDQISSFRCVRGTS